MRHIEAELLGNRPEAHARVAGSRHPCRPIGCEQPIQEASHHIDGRYENRRRDTLVVSAAAPHPVRPQHVGDRIGGPATAVSADDSPRVRSTSSLLVSKVAPERLCRCASVIKNGIVGRRQAWCRLTWTDGAISDEQRQQVDFSIGKVPGPEDRQCSGHGDSRTHGDVGQGLPASAREQGVFAGDPDRAAGAGRHPEKGFVAVGVEAGERRDHHGASVIERVGRHLPAGGADLVPLLGRAHLAGVRIDHRRVPRDALSHRGPGTDDVEGAGLQAGHDLVEVVEAGGRTGDRVAAIEGLLQLVHRQRQQIGERAGGVDDPVLGHLEHLGLGFVEGFGDVVGLRVGEIGDLAGHADHPPQHGSVLHDLRVARRVRNGRRGVLQFEQELGTADLVEQTVAAQLVGNRDDVDRLAGGHEPANRRVHVLVCRLVEVLHLEAELGNGADHLTRQQQRAEEALLGVQVVWRDPSTLEASRRAGSSVSVVVALCHRVTTFVGPACGQLVPTTCEVPGDNRRVDGRHSPTDGHR